MKGGLRQRAPGVWEVRLEAGRDPISGRRAQISRTVRGSKREAQRLLNELLADAGNRQGGPAKVTFRSLSEQWLDLVQFELSPTTIHRYRILLNNRILPSIGDLQIQSIKASDLDRLYTGLSRKAYLAPATVRQIHAVIRRAFRQAVLWGWIDANPAANATPPRISKTTPSPPDVDQVQRLLNLATDSDPEFARLLHLAATTGARRGELCALRWRNLDFKRSTLTIDRSIVDLPGGLSEKDTKTHMSRRIAIDLDTLSDLKDQWKQANSVARKAGLSLHEDAFIFSSEPDGSIPLVPGRVTKKFQTLRDSIGLETVRFHDLRHFTATRLIAAGIPVRTVSGRLGHASPNTTLTVYAHFVEASDQEAAKVIGTLVKKKKSEKKPR